jgi:hypothetical protein
MRFRSTAAALVILAATTAWSQSGRPLASNSRPVSAKSNAFGMAENARAQSAMHQRVEEMGSTLTRMHALFKQMQAKTLATSSTDQLVKANLEMWGLLLADLDKQYAQMRLVTRTREDLEARRAAMYKQAEEKAASAKKTPEESGSNKPEAAATADTGSTPTTAGASVSEPATPQTPAASSPN